MKVVSVSAGPGSGTGWMSLFPHVSGKRTFQMIPVAWVPAVLRADPPADQPLADRAVFNARRREFSKKFRAGLTILPNDSGDGAMIYGIFALIMLPGNGDWELNPHRRFFCQILRIPKCTLRCLPMSIEFPLKLPGIVAQTGLTSLRIMNMNFVLA